MLKPRKVCVKTNVSQLLTRGPGELKVVAREGVTNIPKSPEALGFAGVTELFFPPDVVREAVASVVLVVNALVRIENHGGFIA